MKPTPNKRTKSVKGFIERFDRDFRKYLNASIAYPLNQLILKIEKVAPAYAIELTKVVAGMNQEAALKAI